MYYDPKGMPRKVKKYLRGAPISRKGELRAKRFFRTCGRLAASDSLYIVGMGEHSEEGAALLELADPGVTAYQLSRDWEPARFGFKHLRIRGRHSASEWFDLADGIDGNDIVERAYKALMDE